MIFHNDIYMYRTSLQLDKSLYNSVHTVKYLSGVYQAAQNKTLVVCYKSDAMFSLIRRIQNKCDDVWSLVLLVLKRLIVYLLSKKCIFKLNIFGFYTGKTSNLKIPPW